MNSMETSRGFMVTLVALIEAVMALTTVVPRSVVLGLMALGVPLGIWYHHVMRKRSKWCPITSHSGPYFPYFLLVLTVTQFSRFRQPGDMMGGCGNWLVVFGQHVPRALRHREQSLEGRQ